MNLRTPKKLFLVYLALLFTLSAASAQGYEVVSLSENTSFQKTLKGFTPNFIKSPVNGAAYASTGSGNIYLSYYPDTGFIGKDTLILEFKTGPAPKGSIFYKGYAFEVGASILITEVDYHLMYTNGQADTLDVLANDTSTAGGLTLSEISVVSRGSAGLSGDTLLWYQPDTAFSGMVQLDYRVCDSVGTCKLGQVVINVVDTMTLAQRDTLVRSVKKNGFIDLTLPADDFSVTDFPIHGDIVHQSGPVYRYTPDQDFTGKDTMVLQSGSIIRDIFMHILPYDAPNEFLVDDEVYTAEGVTVNFDVQDNDLIGHRFKLKNFTTPDEGVLTYNGNGNFSYEPVAGFSGLKTFKYTVCPTYNNCETAEVRIFVSNSKPENTFNYKFNTLKNVPLVIDYQVPIDYFDFDEHLEPVHGALDIYDGQQTIIVECDTITGRNLVVYSPDTDFYGHDEFELNYRIPQTGYSAVVKVEVNVINAMPDSTCACINGCVWPGDVDYDGRVTVKDLLPLGYFVGYQGPQRDSSNTNYWIGQYCDDWAAADNAWKINPKHADTDGNGQVNAIDTQAISQYYYNEHDLVEKDISLPRKFPLVLTPLFTNLDSGDIAVILVGIGTPEDPVYDLSGFTYSYIYDPDVVDSASLRIDFHDDCWFTDQSPVLDLFKQPWDGRVDAGFTRTGGKVATGFGIVSTLSFGVEEDVEGIRKTGNDRIITVKVDDAYAMDGNGEMFRVEGAAIQLRLTGKSEEPGGPADPDKLAVFPNPSSGIVRLFLNGQNHMQNVEVYGLSGQLIDQVRIGRSQKAEIDLGYLQNGLYILKVETTKGPILKKVQILH